MTSQAIEGTGMTLRMSGGWTSDITEMTLPYSVRQAIDDTHLGDTMIRWVPSKKIEHGTMAIRFWHDPARQLPITGDPEMMVITYPDGVNHLTVVGFVEKIGKESIKVGELMQTDALVRVIDYPKAAAVTNGSFPMWTGALTGKVVTDIIDTATLRYLVDTTTTSPCEPVKATIPGVVADVPRYGLVAIETLDTVVFGRKGFCSPVSATGNNQATVRPATMVDDLTVALVISYGPWVSNIVQLNQVSLMGIVGSSSDITGVSFDHKHSPYWADHYDLRINNTQIYSTITDGDGATTTNKSRIVVLRRKLGVTTLKINNVTKSCTQVTGSFSAPKMACGFGSIDIGGRGRFYVRDYAFWDYALSDTDFATINDQLCAEYGIT